MNLRNNIPSDYTVGIKDIRQKSPDTYTGSPISKFSGFETRVDLKNYHPFGSPVYVLNNSLQARKSHNKWIDRSRVGIFLQYSQNHSSSVPLVLNTASGNVSPQFHCIYDDEFATCRRDVKFNSVWQDKAKLMRPLVDSKLAPTTLSSIPLTQNVPTTINFELSTQHQNAPPSETNNLPDEFQHQWTSPPITQPSAPIYKVSKENINNTDVPTSDTVITQPEQVTRFGRIIRPPQRFAGIISSPISFLSTFSPRILHSDNHLLQPSTANYSEPHPLALFASHIFSFVATDPDTMTLREALAQPDRKQFLEAMKKELNDHISRGHWKVIPIKHVPSHKQCLPMVWAMKRKRNPIGEILKWKA